MKIGFDAKRAFFNRTGLGNYSRTLIRIVAAMGKEHALTLYTPRGPFLSESNDLHAFKNVVVRTPSMPGRLLPSFWRTFLMARDVKKDGMDLFHGLSHELPSGIEKTKVPSIVTIHDLIFLKHPDYYPAVDRYIYDRKVRHALRATDRVVAITEETKQDLAEYYKVPLERMEVVYQSCNPLFAVQGDAETDKLTRKRIGLPDEYLLYVGTVNERKNLLSLIKALPLMKSLSLPLVAVGNGGAYRKKVIEHTVAAGLMDRVWFVDHVENADLPSVYRGAACFIYPSLSEGFGIPIIEAIFSKVPVVTSDRMSLHEAGGPGCVYMDPLDPGAIAHAVEEALGDAFERRKRIEAGLQYVQRFTEEKVGARLLNLYSRVAAKA